MDDEEKEDDDENIEEEEGQAISWGLVDSRRMISYVSSNAAQTAAARRPTSVLLEQGQMRIVETRLMAREVEPIEASIFAAGALDLAGGCAGSMPRVASRCCRISTATATQSESTCLGMLLPKPKSMASMVLVLLELLVLLFSFILSSAEWMVAPKFVVCNWGELAFIECCRKLDSAPSSDAFESVATLSSLAVLVATAVVVGPTFGGFSSSSVGLLGDEGHRMHRRFPMRRAGL